LVLEVEGLLFGVRVTGKWLEYKQLDFVRDYYHYYVGMLSYVIIIIAQDNFDIAPSFTYLDCTEVKYFMSKFERLKDENFLFNWGHQQCIYTFYHSPMYAYTGGVLHIYKKMLNNIFN